MPIVAHSGLPTFRTLAEAGQPVLSAQDALTQDIRELHIGLLNMMPDAALKVTEQQFIRLVGGSNAIVQLYVHPFTVPGLERSAESRAWIEEYYAPLDKLREEGLDALIVTGANVSNPDLADEPFWEPLGEVMAWADEHVTSTLCSCLATHAMVQQRYGVRRRRLMNKRWGVFPHRVVDDTHPLLLDTNSRFDVPHSRWNAVSSRELREAGVRVLIESLDGDFHMGTSADGIRTVYLQGHQEYDRVSLLKEFKREVDLYLAGEVVGAPPLPDHYLTPGAARFAWDHVDRAGRAVEAGHPVPPFPEAALSGELDNTWTDTGKAIFNNWLGLVYRLTDHERGVPFMSGVDPDDPLASL